jgi:hypothetical protein
MEFSAPIKATRGLVLHIPDTRIVVSVHGNELHVNMLPLLSRLQTVFVPSSPQFLVCSPSPPYLIATSCRQHVTVAALVENPLDDASSNSGNVSNLMTFELDRAMAIEAVGITSAALLVFHTNRIGVSIFALSHRGSSPGDPNQRLKHEHFQSIVASRSIPTFLPFFASPFYMNPPTAMPCTAAFSPCGMYAAIGVKLPSAPALQVVDLSSGTILAQAVGVAALGGSITEVCGVRWLASPQNCIFVWGLPRDGLDAVCLIGADGDLIQTGLPSNAAVTATATDMKTSGTTCENTSEDSDGGIKGDKHSRVNRTMNDDRRQSAGAAYYFRELGVRSAAVSPDNGMVAIGCFDGTLRLINVSTWKLIVSLNLDSPCIDDRNPPAVYFEREKLVPRNADDENRADVRNVYEAPQSRGNLPMGDHDCSGGVEKISFFDVVDGYGRFVIPPPTSTDSTSHGAAETILQCGVAAVQFSADGRWLSARSQKLRNVVFVVDITRARLASTVVLREEARCMSWSTQRLQARGGHEGTANPMDGDAVDVDDGSARLAFVSDGSSIYFWSERGAAALRVPQGLTQIPPPSGSKRSEATGGAERNPRTRNPGAVVHSRAPTKGFRPSRFLWSSGDRTGLAVDPTCSSSFSVMYMD